MAAETPILRLPTGMRDHAPEAASARRRIVDGVLAVFERRGFARVITPAFEYEDVLALGLGDAARAATFRFVEPSTGQVVALRPDITPQIARLIATRYRDQPGPVRLCYEGTVVRLERGARGQREQMQAGVELAGVAGAEGDAEAIALAVEALAAVGITHPTIDLGHLGLAREVLSALALPDAALGEARRCIAKHDGAGLAEVLKQARGVKAAVDFARLLPDLAGAPAVLDDARLHAPNGGIKRALAELGDIVAALGARKLAVRLHVDLGEVRGFDYYTGVRFQAFVAGASDAVLRGGRYDELLARYGRPSPAVGFAVDVDAVAGLLETAAASPTRATARSRRARSKA
jgi:ATP phosphoribosyltransferase regulatory subunit